MQEKIKQFFTDHPAISKEAICREAGISTRLINYVLDGRRTLTDRTIEKLTPILKKYGY